MLLSVIGFTALGLQTYGYQREEASKASIMTFLEIPFAYVIQCTFFHEKVDRISAIGIVLITSSAIVNGYYRRVEAMSAGFTAVATKSTFDLDDAVSSAELPSLSLTPRWGKSQREGDCSL
jgi:hypothetical protein